MRALATVVALIAVVSAGCAHSSRPTPAALHALDGGTRNGIASPVKPALPYVFPLLPLCTTAGPQRITSVSAWRPTGGIHVVDWGVHRVTRTGDLAGGIGAEQTTVAQIGGFGGMTVASKCEPDGESFDQFYISAASTAKRAQMDGVAVRYTAGRTQHTLHVYYRMALCAGATTCAGVKLS